MADHLEHRRDHCRGLWRGRVGPQKAFSYRHRPQSFFGRVLPALCGDLRRNSRRTHAFDAPAYGCGDRLQCLIVTFVPLLVGDAIGIAVMTPLTLRLILNPGRSPIRFSRTLVPEILFYVLLITVTLWIIIGTESANGFKFFYLLF